jgi:hypothetical protein
MMTTAKATDRGVRPPLCNLPEITANAGGFREAGLKTWPRIVKNLPHLDIGCYLGHRSHRILWLPGPSRAACRVNSAAAGVFLVFFAKPGRYHQTGAQTALEVRC